LSKLLVEKEACKNEEHVLNIKLLAECLWLTLVILTTWEAENGWIMVQDQPGQIVHNTPSLKWTRSVAQIVECLLCKCEALSSNSSTTKKKVYIYICINKLFFAMCLYVLAMIFLLIFLVRKVLFVNIMLEILCCV
jgi:hypothetical protein